MKIEPKWTALILLIFGSLISLQYWAGAQWRALQGPDILAVDPQGNLYVNIRSDILRFDKNGHYIDQRNVNVLGIQQFLGGISFFPDGDLLMVPREHNPSLLQSVLTLYRITSATPLEQPVSPGKLSRCDWATFHCTPLPDFKGELTRTFWTDIDQDENIFLADTAGHTLYWLDKNGRELDALEDKARLQFPNQVKRVGDHLLVANCNDNSLSRIALGEGQFGTAFEQFKLESPLAPPHDRWPTGVVTLGNDYFVLAQGNNLMNGSVYRMDATGDIKSVFRKTPDSDFIALAPLGNEILVANYSSLSIHRYSIDGDKTGVFTSPELEKITAPMKSRQTFYRRLEGMAKNLFLFLLATGFLLALWLEKKHRQALPEPAPQSLAYSNTSIIPPTANDSRVQWLEYHFLWKNINRWFVWLWVPLLLLAIPTLFSAEEESVAESAAFLVMHGITLLSHLNAKRLMQSRLGVMGPWVLIQNKHGDTGVANEKAVYCYRSFGRAILMAGTQDLQVQGRYGIPLLDGQHANEQVNRLMVNARLMTVQERWAWLLEHKTAAVAWELLLVALYVSAILTLRH